MLVMFAYVSLSPACYEIFAGLLDCDASLGEAAHFGKTFGYLYSFFEIDIASDIDSWKESRRLTINKKPYDIL
jgi:hypothetical protein